MASSDVVLSAALRNNLLSLQGTQRLIDTVQLRLATGLKVNSALDGPQQFFTSQALSNRAGDLGRLLDGINLSIRTIEEADKGVTALTNLIEQAQSVAENARSEALAAQGFASIRGTADLSAVDSLTLDSGGTIAAGDDFRIVVKREGVAAALTSAEINIAATDTIYNLAGYINADATVNQYVRASVDSGGRLRIDSLEEGAIIRFRDSSATLGTDGYAFLGLGNYVETETFIATTRLAASAVAGREIRSAAMAATAANGEYQTSQLLQVGANQAGFIAAGDTVDLTVTVDGVTSATINLVANTDTVQELLDSINNDVNIGDLVEASLDTDTGEIVLRFADGVSQAEIQFDATAAADDTNFGFGTGASDLTGAGAAATDATSEWFTFVGSSTDLTQYQDDYNDIRDQIDGLVEDANFRGVNLLNGDDLTTFFNEDRTNSLITSGVDFTALGLGLAEADFTNSSTVQLSIDATLSALDSVRNFGQSISNSLSIIQTRRDFTESTIATLKAGAGDLVNADQNEEGANLLALQTRQQLGVTALSLAAQSQQSVLRLF
jgi:flagellin